MLQVHAPEGVPEIGAGTDLVAVLLGLVELRDGDVVVVTSKVVSKAEGQVVTGDREAWIDAETDRVVAVRGATRIVRNRLGLTMAAAGVDNSNVEAGAVVLLPRDPDASARRIRAGIAERAGVRVGVVVTDTAGRTWREGQTDIAIGAAGLVVAESFAGREDAHGNPLLVTAPAVADELASAAELAQGKLGGRPFAVVRGRANLVLPAGQDGPGAAALIREDGTDLFGYGAREAVLRALVADPAHAAPFGVPVDAEELIVALARVGAEAVATSAASVSYAGPRRDAVRAVAFAHGWIADPDREADTDAAAGVRLRPRLP